MEPLDLYQRLALALAIGLLIGIERGWHERTLPEGRYLIRAYAAPRYDPKRGKAPRFGKKQLAGELTVKRAWRLGYGRMNKVGRID